LLSAKQGSAVADDGGDSRSKLPPSPPTTPFVVPLTVYSPKPPVAALDPVPQINAGVGNSG
jgi:hypothetical protein